MNLRKILFLLLLAVAMIPTLVHSIGQAESIVSTKEINLTSKYYQIEMEIPQLTLKGENFTTFNQQIAAEAQNAVDSLIKDAKELEEPDSVVGEMSYSLHSSFFCAQSKLQQFSIISLVINDYLYMGGAHGMPGTTVYNIDGNTGQILKYSDVFSASSRDYFNSSIRRKIEEEMASKTEEKIYFNGETADIDAAVFWFDKEGVTFQFQPYAIAPYCEGSPKFTFSRKEVESLLVKKEEQER